MTDSFGPSTVDGHIDDFDARRKELRRIQVAMREAWEIQDAKLAKEIRVMDEVIAGLRGFNYGAQVRARVGLTPPAQGTVRDTVASLLREKGPMTASALCAALVVQGVSKTGHSARAGLAHAEEAGAIRRASERPLTYSLA